MIRIALTNVQRVYSARHVGIDVVPSLKCTNSIETRCSKGRGSLFSILDLRNEDSEINPMILANMTEKIVFPTTHYGCELWNSMTLNDLNIVEKCVRFCAKRIQNFSQRTRTDIALSMLGWSLMESNIDKRKLLFLEKLCTTPTYLLARQIFDLRLQLFINGNFTIQKGFIPDISRILRKYNLTYYLYNYAKSGRFASKWMWKIIVKKTVKSFTVCEWRKNIFEDEDFIRFRRLHLDL